MTALYQPLVWVSIGLASAPVWLALICELWEAVVRPRLIPAAEIDTLAAATLLRYGDDAEEMAFTTEDRAWRYLRSR